MRGRKGEQWVGMSGEQGRGMKGIRGFRDEEVCWQMRGGVRARENVRECWILEGGRWGRQGDEMVSYGLRGVCEGVMGQGEGLTMR